MIHTKNDDESVRIVGDGTKSVLPALGIFDVFRLDVDYVKHSFFEISIFEPRVCPELVNAV